MFGRWLLNALTGLPRRTGQDNDEDAEMGRGVADRLLLPLEGTRTLLRPGRNSDWEAWADLRRRSRDFLTPWEPDWPADALSHAAFRRRLSRQRWAWREDSSYGFLTFDRSTQELVGGITLNNVHRGVAQIASVGYWIGEPYARRGYTSEAVQLVAAFAFLDLGLHRLEAACMPQNVPSQGVLHKAGFLREGLARGYLRINGIWEDHYLYGLLREDARLPPIKENQPR